MPHPRKVDLVPWTGWLRTREEIPSGLEEMDPACPTDSRQPEVAWRPFGKGQQIPSLLATEAVFLEALVHLQVPKAAQGTETARN